MPITHLRRRLGAAGFLAAGLLVTGLALAAPQFGPLLEQADWARLEGRDDEAARLYGEIVTTGVAADNLDTAEQLNLAAALQELAILRLKAIAEGPDGPAKTEAQDHLGRLQTGFYPRLSAQLTRTVSHGEEVDLADYVVEGKTTLFDFTSRFCPPCMQLKPHIQRLAVERRDDIAVVFVDINRPDVVGQIDWQSPVIKQYQVVSLPHFKVYGPDGQLQAEDRVVLEPDPNREGQMRMSETGNSTAGRDYLVGVLQELDAAGRTGQ